MPRLTYPTPILCVSSIPASIDYYVEKLGFEKNWDWIEPGSDEPGFACVGRDDVCIFLCRQGQGSPGTWIYISVDNCEELYEQFRQSGANIQRPPTDCPWGMREMHVTDLDAHILRFGHGIEETPIPVR
jgi:uncharacterized glyoxalase superfamily protein PhnB